MVRTAVINVVGLTPSLLGDHTPHLNAFAARGGLARIGPAFPAVTCSVQADYLTGRRPREHGIVANGWFDRDYRELCFWKQSNHLVQAPKLWEVLAAADPGFTCAQLFWWFNMYSSVDYAITPRPLYPADGRKVFDIHTGPMDLREQIKADLGPFPFHAFWGPRAGLDSSRWIAASARWIEEKYAPTLNLVYLPHLDYNLQRLGPSHPGVRDDVRAIDTLVGELIEFFESRSVRILLLSEYGITDVDRPLYLNRIFRQKGWITVKDELGLVTLDCGASRAFALCDHQVAHIYVNDPGILPQVRACLEGIDGVERVLDAADQQAAGLHHPRSGDLIAVTDRRSWFAYYHWLDDRVAPDFARCVDIHRKAGYDPVELFADPQLKFPALKVALFLLKKKLGFRALLNLIPLDASLVKGSHGRVSEDRAEWPVLMGAQTSADLPATDVFCILRDTVLGD